MNNDIEREKNTAIVAYLTIIGSIVAIFMNQDENRSEFASFHIRQAIGIFLTWALLGYIIGHLDNWIMSSALYVCIFLLWLYGFLGCLSGEKRVVTIVGELYQKFFKSL